MALLADNGLFYLAYGVALTLRLKNFKNRVFEFYFRLSTIMMLNVFGPQHWGCHSRIGGCSRLGSRIKNEELKDNSEHKFLKKENKGIVSDGTG